MPPPNTQLSVASQTNQHRSAPHQSESAQKPCLKHCSNISDIHVQGYTHLHRITEQVQYTHKILLYCYVKLGCLSFFYKNTTFNFLTISQSFFKPYAVHQREWIPDISGFHLLTKAPMMLDRNVDYIPFPWGPTSWGRDSGSKIGLGRHR